MADASTATQPLAMTATALGQAGAIAHTRPTTCASDLAGTQDVLWSPTCNSFSCTMILWILEGGSAKVFDSESMTMPKYFTYLWLR